MIQKFDIFNRPESPNFILCNPDSTEINSIIAYERSISLRYADASEISFKVYAKTTDIKIQVISLKYYDKIQTKRLVLVEDIGYFQIQNVNETDDGIEKYKTVSAISIQNEMGFKSMQWFDGTYKFYDAIDITDTLMGEIMFMLPDWTISSISSDLFTKYRTFEAVNTTLLDFILSNVSEAYECVFLFDFLHRMITVKSIADLIQNPQKTEIYLSFRNLLKQFQIEEQSDQIVTCLSVYGQDLDIRQVNPLGTSNIYDFSSFMTKEWMSQDLIDAITAWKSLLTSSQTTYANYLSSLQTKSAELLVLESELTDLESDLKSLEEVRSARIEQGIAYTDINSQIVTAKANIVTKQTAIDAKTSEITTVTNSMTAINTSLSFDNNFSAAQLLILDKFIYEQDYTNTYYVVTDQMTPVDIQYSAQELYNEGVNALTRMSQPRYTFKIDSTNFMFIKDFAQFTSQFELGCMVTIELDEDVFAYPILLEMQYNFDDPNDFSLTFGNRFKLGDSVYTFNELLSQSYTSANRTSASWNKLNSFSKTYETDVDDFLNNAFDVSKKAIINSNNQTQTWDSSGMTFRKITSGSYDPAQMKIINNQIVFTDNNWNSVKTVIGQVSLTGGGTAYGTSAEVLVGRIIAGNSLTITNNSNAGLSTFTVDETGATLKNANLSLINSTVKSQILLDPTNGFKIQKNTGTSGSPTWANQFYADASGNIILKGKVTAVEGAIANWIIDTDTLSSGNVGLYSGATYKYTTNSVAKNIRIYAGATLQATTDTSGIPFVIDEYGRLKASNAYISGNIVMAGGSKIGNWSVTDTAIYNLKTTLSSTTTGVYIGTDGINIGGLTDFFKITSSGVLTATSANITGTINATSGYLQDVYVNSKLYLNTFASGNFWLSGNDVSYRIYMYNSSTQYFRVTPNGLMQCSGATISGTIGGSIMYSTGIASSNGSTSAYYICNGNLENIRGSLGYDNSGSYPDNSNRVILQSGTDIALKLISGGNMSLQAGSARKIYMASPVEFQAGTTGVTATAVFG